ncbi:hypothetical protein U1Q18_005718 [Sarracenia purpurea var. burkii]
MMPPLVISAVFNTESFYWVNACNSGEIPLSALALAAGHRCFCPIPSPAIWKLQRNRLRNRLCNFQNQSSLAPATSQGAVWIAPLPNQSPHLIRVAHCRNHHRRHYSSSVPTPTKSRLATGHRTPSP